MPMQHIAISEVFVTAECIRLSEQSKNLLHKGGVSCFSSFLSSAMGRQSEGQLIFDRAHKEGSPEAFEMAFSRLKAERAWVAEERERLLKDLETTGQKEGALLGLAEARDRLCQFLKQGDNASWREVFTALGLEIRVDPAGKVELTVGIPIAQIAIAPKGPGPFCQGPHTGTGQDPAGPCPHPGGGSGPVSLLLAGHRSAGHEGAELGDNHILHARESTAGPARYSQRAS